jgi:hypothetical protein
LEEEKVGYAIELLKHKIERPIIMRVLKVTEEWLKEVEKLQKK